MQRTTDNWFFDVQSRRNKFSNDLVAYWNSYREYRVIVIFPYIRITQEMQYVMEEWAQLNRVAMQLNSFKIRMSMNWFEEEMDRFIWSKNSSKRHCWTTKISIFRLTFNFEWPKLLPIKCPFRMSHEMQVRSITATAVLYAHSYSLSITTTIAPHRATSIRHRFWLVSQPFMCAVSFARNAARTSFVSFLMTAQ